MCQKKLDMLQMESERKKRMILKALPWKMRKNPIAQRIATTVLLQDFVSNAKRDIFWMVVLLALVRGPTRYMIVLKPYSFFDFTSFLTSFRVLPAAADETCLVTSAAMALVTANNGPVVPVYHTPASANPTMSNMMKDIGFPSTAMSSFHPSRMVRMTNHIGILVFEATMLRLASINMASDSSLNLSRIALDFSGDKSVNVASSIIYSEIHAIYLLTSIPEDIDGHVNFFKQMDNAFNSLLCPDKTSFDVILITPDSW